MSTSHGWFVVTLILSAALAGCASSNLNRAGLETSPRASPPAQEIAATTTPSRTIDVSGVWEGIRIDSCDPLQVDPMRCNATMQLTLTVLQRADKISGFYRCATGTVDCYNMDETGVIKQGSIRPGLLQFRVMLEDGSSCLFNSVPASERMTGGFMCLQGAAILERGRWRVQRSY
ncbi:MAG: hypothetical protein ACREQX_00965 [Candidatus Binataceae bacterium]